MLLQQQIIQLSAYFNLYILIVPQDDLLIKIKKLIGFTFIYCELVNKLLFKYMNAMQKAQFACLSIYC